MKITVKRPSVCLCDIFFGDVFFHNGTFYIKTCSTLDDGDYLCVDISNGDIEYFGKNDTVEYVEGDFIVKG